MNIPISKPIIEKEEKNAVNAVLASGMLAAGPKVAELERAFTDYCDLKYAVAFSSGTAAIHAGLYALGIGPGDEVITTPFTFVATANPVLMLGAKVIFADIAEDDFNLDPDSVTGKVTGRTRAVIPVDLYGQVYDYARISAVAEQHGLKILEDACQAIGAEQGGRQAGNFGEAGIFSLYATKNIMSGEGGVLVTDNKSIAEKCRRFRHHGQSEQYEYVELGYNYRTTDLCAAIAVEQLKKADRFNDKRIGNAARLTDGLKDINGLVTPVAKPGNKHVFHQYTIRITPECSRSRDELVAHLKSEGIGCGIYYPKPLHLHPHFRKLGHKAGDFPVAERMSCEVLSLPVHPSVSEDDIDYIVGNIKSYCQQG